MPVNGEDPEAIAPEREQGRGPVLVEVDVLVEADGLRRPVHDEVQGVILGRHEPADLANAPAA